MKKLQLHALSQILDAFLQPLGEKFSRLYNDTKLIPSNTAVGILMMVMNATDHGYESVMRHLRFTRPDLISAEPSAGAYCRARMKFTEEMFRLGWSNLQKCMTELCADAYPLVHGKRLVAIDGVVFSGRRSKRLFKQLRKKTRGRPPKKNKAQPRLTVVVLVDVLTRAPIAWAELEPGTGERVAAKKLLKYLDSTCILLADRGFPSRELLGFMRDAGIHFVMRMLSGVNAFREVSDIISLRKKKDIECVISCGESKKSGSILVRLIRCVPRKMSKKHPRKNMPEEWALITTLPCNSRWTKTIIMELYHERWAIETFFRDTKELMNADTFHSHSLEGMLQEISFMMLAGVLVAASEICAQDTDDIPPEKWNNDRKKLCNRATLITTIRDMISVDPTHRNIEEALDEALGNSQKRAQKRRPGRWYLRISKSTYSKWKAKFHKAKY